MSEDAIEMGYDLKGYVDSELQARNIPIGQYDVQALQRGDKDAIASIMKARKRDFWSCKEIDHNYQSLVSELENIQIGNQEIEEKVKMELLGLDDNPFKRFLYHVFTFFQKLSGEAPEQAQDIIKRQLNRVDTVAQGINQASKVIDERVTKLDKYYDGLTQKLETGTAYRVTLRKGIEDTANLMEQTTKVLDETDDSMERLRYNSAFRKLRKNLQAKTWELKMTDREILDIKAEIPFIDTFGDFCQTYSYALKESFQKVQTVKSHLTNIMGLYFEMMRSNHINYALRESVEKLLEYTNNMGKSLLRAKALILEVNNNEMYSHRYEKRRDDLDDMVDEVIDSNAGVFRQLESKVRNFLEVDN